MTVFKAFLQILKRNIGILITYTAILIVFSVFSLQTGESTATFQETRPTVYIANHDEGSAISETLVEYMTEKSQIIELENAGAGLDDALFYRQVNLAMEIREGFGEKLIRDDGAEITVRSAGDYGGSLAEMNLSRFLEVAGAYRLIETNAEKLAEKVEKVLAEEVEIELISTLDTSEMARAAYYYNFLNYPLLVGGIFMICLILLSFREKKVAERIAVGGMSTERINRILLCSNCLFAFVLWLVYVAVSFVIVGKAMFSLNGMWFILNSLVFAFCVTSLAFLIANLVKSRNALNGIVNVVGLGSSFLCGAFVPVEWLPDSVRVVAHVLPTYWYIDANNQIQKMEEFGLEAVWPVIVNMLVVIGFAVGFVILANVSGHLSRRGK